MCITVLIHDRGGELIAAPATYGELFMTLGVPPLIQHFDPIGFGPVEYDDCLCSVDLDATARVSGYSFHYDFGNAVFTPLNGDKKEGQKP